MRSFNTKCFTPRNAGARKLAAATRAIMEPVESRLMMSITPVTEQVAAITAKFETVPNQHSGSTAEDPAIWVNPNDASLSTVIGTDKRGALTVYSLDGQVIQRITGSGYNSVDVRGNLVAATNLSNNTVSFFTIDPATRQLSAANARTIRPSFSGETYGLAMYQSAESGKTYVFVNNRSGNVQQFEVTQTADGKYDAHSVRRFAVGSIAEDMVADDETGALYIAQEDVALWKYGAEPTDGNVRTQVDKVGNGGHLAADIEGLGLYKTANGQGYLIASSQGSSDYVVYDRETGEYVTRFNISSGVVDGTQSSAGLEVTSANLGGDFSGGLLVVTDTKNDDGNENYKLVSWADVANAQGIPLVIDGVQNPGNPANPPAVNNTFPVITGINLIDADTGEVLQQLNDGGNVDLSQYAGRKLNIEAVMTPQKGSVRFTLNDFSRIENRAPYRIGGDFGEVAFPALEAGSNTLTLTTYREIWGRGEVGNVYTLTFTVTDGDQATPPPANNNDGTPTVNKPGTPTGVTATANGSDSITVKWNAVKGAAGYKISRSENGSTYKAVATVEGTSFTDDNLADGKKYYYKVTAYNAVGSSDLSSAASATTKPAIDTTPIDDIVEKVTGRPDAKNTGVTGTLTNVGNMQVKSNTVYQNLIFKGDVDLRGVSNVTFINCVFDAAGDKYAVRADDGKGTNRVFKNCEFKNMSSAAIYGGDFEVYNSYVHHSKGDGFKATQNVLIQGCYITMLGMSDGAHADGVQIRGGDNIKIIGNFFDMPTNRSDTSSNAAMFLQAEGSRQSKNILFSGNWCVGGNYTVAAYASQNVKITNNIFYSGTPRYGFGNLFDGVIWEGNKTDKGASATPKMK